MNPYEPPRVTDLGTVEDLVEAERELEAVKGVLVEHDEDYGSDDDRDASGHLSAATPVRRLIRERDELRKRVGALKTLGDVEDTIAHLKQMITQLQERNRDLVDERRAADIHYRDMKVVYVAHPLSGPDRDANIARASRWCAWAFKSGYAPVADWIVLASQLDESYREQGLRADCALIKRCDELWYVGGRISDGMRIEGATARLVGVPVKDLTEIGEEPPEYLHPGGEFVNLRRET